MGIRCGLLTRGKGKLFLRVTSDDSRAVGLLAHATRCDGSSLPSSVMPFGEGASWVVIAAALGVPQSLSLETIDRKGRRLEVRTRRLGNYASSLFSKLNTVTGRQGLEAQRNLDYRPNEFTAMIRVERLLRRGDGAQVLRGIAKTRLLGHLAGRPPAPKLAMRVFDRAGHRIEIDGGTSLWAVADEGTPEGPGILSLQFSVSCDGSRPPFAVSLDFPDGEAMGGFSCIEPWDLKLLRDEYERTYEATGNSERYAKWFAHVHRATELDLEIQRRVPVPKEPRFSIVVPLFETRREHLRAMVSSVLDQTYGSYELILVNASPESDELRREVDRAEAMDGRVRAIELPGNLGIASNTNMGIRAAQGEFVCFLDHDDVLEPDCLYHYAEAVEADPETDLIYCDEDKLRDNRLAMGFMKPDFDWTLLSFHNYVTHFLCIRRTVLDAIELPGPEFDGAQDYELTMRAAERARSIVHVPRVLYHWRMGEGSTAGNEDAKPWIVDAGRRVVQGHLRRLGIEAEVAPRPGHPGLYEWRGPAPEPDGIGIVVTDAADQDPLPCLESLVEGLGASSICYVTSHTRNVEAARPLGIQILEVGETTTEVEARNQGAQHLDARVLCFASTALRPPDDDWVPRLAARLGYHDVAITGPELVFADGLIHSAGVTLPKSGPRLLSHLRPAESPGVSWWGILAHQVIAVSAHCLMVTRRAYEELGGFDEAFSSDYAAIDFCLRAAEHGLACVVDPEVRCGIALPCPDSDPAYRSVEDFVVRRDAVRLDSGEATARAQEGSLFASPLPERRLEVARDAGVFLERWYRYYVDGDPHYNANNLTGGSNYELVPASGLDSNMPADRMGEVPYA